MLTGTSDDFGVCTFPSNNNAQPNNTNTAQKSLSFYITVVIAGCTVFITHTDYVPYSALLFVSM